MKVDVRYGVDLNRRKVPKLVLLIAQDEDEQRALDLLGNVAKKEHIEVKGTMQLSDGYGDMYLSFPVPEEKP